MVATTVIAATTVSGAVTLAWSAAVIIALLALLISKELASGSEHPRARWYAKVSSVGVVPLIFALTGIVWAKLLLL
ncbi:MULTISPECIES: hypothetical protein [unclassified Meiothermus]|uniref:hypothetical protein n=1 Tax=unclassified Meiothermus TaxID=370471 RepID=UPI000D7D0EFF|nr:MULTISPECIES: hypothetical protein [unclassified Meiothermus]PZA06390.1 hypothetical protein DNA98_13510 [Meiothermus sp. Pnk-1]RYM36991.1 hypothetical protein EWH23_07820 [Meiothermus sp. PNK-Is4]